MSSIAYPEGIPAAAQGLPLSSPGLARRGLLDLSTDPNLAQIGAGAQAQIGSLGQANFGNPNLFYQTQPAAPQQNPISGANPVTGAPGVGFSSLNKPALSLNPQLPQVQSSLVTDATDNAQQAQLAAEISQKYNDVLKQLGYPGPNTGNFVMGTVESDANRQRDEANRSIQLADEAANQQRQLEGTLFSGRRATEQARAEHPFVQSLADLDISVPRSLSDLYEQAGNITNDYTLQNNLLLADLANRRAAAMMQAPGPGGTPPPPPPPPPPGPNAPAPYDPYAATGTTQQQISDAMARAGYTDPAQNAAMTAAWANNMAPGPDNALIYYQSLPRAGRM